MQRLRLHLSQVTADEQRRRHHTPHGEVGVVFLLGHATPHLQHVHVVIVTATGVGRQVEVLLDDVLHRSPLGTYVLRHTPRGGHAADPRAGVVPAADVQSDILAPRPADGIGYLRIACLLVEPQRVALRMGLTAAVVYLDEVEAQFPEEHVAVLLVVAIESHAHADGVGIIDAAAGVAPRIAVDAGLQSQPVDMLHHGFQSPWETLGVDEQAPRLPVAPAEVAVVDVHVPIPYLAQSFLDHGVGLPHDERVADVHTVGVP